MSLWADVFKDLALFLTSGAQRSKFTLPLSKKSYFVLYDRPGQWCSDSELEQITLDLQRIAKDSQGGRDIPFYGVLLGEREDLKERVISIAYSKAGEPIGFSAQKYLDLKEDKFCLKVLHLGLIFVSPQAQGQNLSYLLAFFPNILLALKSGLRTVWVSNVSQVPAVVGLVAKNYSEVYPDADGTPQSFQHRKYSSLIVRDHREAFGVGEEARWDSGRQVLMNAYTGGSDNLKKSFEDAPKHRDTKINDLCRTQLDYGRGDDFVQVGLLCPAGFVNLFRNKKSKQNAIQMSFNLLLFLLLGALLPLVRWLVSGSEFYAVSRPQQKTLIYSGRSNEV